MTKQSKSKDGLWQSDIIVDMIRRNGFQYISLNPGASFRGLHDSLVNYGDDNPPLILCPHEETAVQIAHGYAKASGKPMIAIVHNLVGMLHANMAVYYAYIDRAPVFIIGATGPLHEGKRRPHIDWTHSANVQGESYRHYTKWDYQPASIEGVPESFMRAYSVMMTEPQGPIYMCYDALLQELPLDHDVPLPPEDAARVPSPMAADGKELAAAADRLLAAENPLLMAEYVGRSAHGFDNMVALAETVGAPVIDINSRLNFPSNHPLNLSMDQTVFGDRDVILNLDVRDWERPATKLDSTNRSVEHLVPESCEWMDIGFAELGLSKWSMDYQRMQNFSLRILADTATAIPALTEICRERIKGDSKLKRTIGERSAAVAVRHDELRASWRQQAREDWDSVPMTPARLASEIWEVIKDEDWVLTANTLRTWARKLWNFDKPYRHAGKSLGTATQIGISIGVALANKGTGRLVVDINSDGDLMFDLGALWVPAKYEIPMLIVMFNNRAYFNDWEHQIRVAEQRGRDVTRAHIGMDLYDPEPDFAGIARSMGWWAEGPIENGGDVGDVLRRAIEVVKSGRPALVDAVTRHR
ncbi:MAG: thiamine pyrophosphate-binding protein [Proteobacteria bacterium]|nr:thiamine pyrophosphate-binding protein [Pseudomonadota bacterium]